MSERRLLFQAATEFLKSKGIDPATTELASYGSEYQLTLRGRRYRIPEFRNSGEPNDFVGDQTTVEHFAAGVEVIGVTGWDHREKLTRAVCLDYDAKDHKAGYSDETLAAVVEAARRLGYVWVRHSKGGRGLCLVAYLSVPLPAETGTQHQKNADAVVDRMCADAGFDFREHCDCKGVVAWVWVPAHKIAQDGFKVLVEPTCRAPEIEPPVYETEPQRAEPTTELLPSHLADIEMMRAAGYSVTVEGNRIKTHVCAFRVLGRGDYNTNSPGTNPSEANCFAYAREYGGWVVHRYGTKPESEAEGWYANSSGCAAYRIPGPDLIECPSPGTASMAPLPTIRLGCDLDRIVNQAIEALAHAPNVYQHGALVQIVEDAPKPKLCLADNGAPQLHPIKLPTLGVILSKVANWERYQEQQNRYVPCSPPSNIVAAVDAEEKYPGISVITGIVNSPVLRADGSIASEPGYDPLTGLYLDIDGIFPPLMSPQEALQELLDILHDFPFASDAHRSAALAAIITLLTRHAFSGPAPFFIVDANASRTGKGLLTDVFTMTVEGRKAARYTPPKADDEMRKLITSVAISGVSYLLFDNIKNTFGGQAIENAMTTGRWSDRILGINKHVDIPLQIVWLGTSNNASLTQDMCGRTCHIRMNTNLERPDLRDKFKHPNLLDYVKANRRTLAIAALSIPAGYVAACRPKQNLPAWGGFEGWSSLVRASLVWAGQPDPAETRNSLIEGADDESTVLRNLMDGWAELGEPMTVGGAIKSIDSSSDNDYPALREAISELSGDRKNALGVLLKRFRGRVLDGRYFSRTDHKTPRWEIRRAA